MYPVAVPVHEPFTHGFGRQLLLEVACNVVYDFVVSFFIKNKVFGVFAGTVVVVAGFVEELNITRFGVEFLVVGITVDVAVDRIVANILSYILLW
jgi:hypothetical protein